VLIWRKSTKTAAQQRLSLAGAPNALALGAVGEAGLAPGVTPAELEAGARLTFEHIREQALELAAKDPASAAVVLRQWLQTNQTSEALPR